MMRCVLILAGSIGLVAATERNPQLDPDEVLRHVTEKVHANDRALLNYTCVEEVTRDFFRPAAGTTALACGVMLERSLQPGNDARRLISTDRLRLEVTLTRRGEIFSWLDAKQFDGEIDQLVHRGPIATGGFGALLNVIFQNDTKNFTFLQDTPMDGRNLMVYSFQADEAHSRHRVKLSHDEWVYTGYSGTLLVDPATANVVRIVFQTKHLPPAIALCETVMTLDFSAEQIGDTPILLPRRMHQRFVAATGVETENTVSFSGCREYRSESTVTYFEQPNSVVPVRQNPPVRPLAVPAGLRFTLELLTPIQSDSAAAGDPFVGRLVEPLRDANRKTLVRKGALVEGRLLRAEIVRTPPQEVILVLKPRTVEIQGAKVPLAAVQDTLKARKSKKRIPIYIPERWEKNAAVFRFSGEHIVLGRTSARTGGRSQ